MRLHTAVAIRTPLVQAIPLQISAAWVRLGVRHPCHTTTHPLLRISMHRLLRTIARREAEAVVVDFTAAARPVVADHLGEGILLPVAVAAAEGHNSSLKPLRLA
jgi:hypothetical protein